MRETAAGGLTRRGFLAGAGALVVSFSLSQLATAQDGKPAGGADLPGSLKDSPLLDSWIRIDADGSITVFTGKIELGQGIKTALIQVAAEELAVDPARITLVTADTSRTPDEGYTAGSQSMQHSATASLHAAAQVRAILVGIAAAQLDLPADKLTAQSGTIRAADGRALGYGALVSGQVLHVAAQPQPQL